jgi:hypothetical protein
MGNVQTNFRAQDFLGASGAAVEPDSAPGEQETPEEQAPGEQDLTVPTGTINEIKAWVGDDQEKAQAALDAENEKENPRSTLVDWLEGVLEDDEE